MRIAPIHAGGHETAGQVNGEGFMQIQAQVHQVGLAIDEDAPMIFVDWSIHIRQVAQDGGTVHTQAVGKFRLGHPIRAIDEQRLDLA